MKFTEEQYRKIVDAWNSQLMYENSTKAVINSLETIYINMREQALALANPLTREWAHDKFVEKEKKYYWRIEQRDEGYEIRLFADPQGFVSSYKFVDPCFGDVRKKSEQLTESEIKAWGYNPEMFDREEV
ncbi:hypothetical protein N2F28_08335 [Leuconostoc falkenbergense]